MKNNKKALKHNIGEISPPAARVLKFGLPVIIVELIVLTLLFLRDRATDATYALHHYPPMMEYIFLSLAILTVGAFLFDYIARREFSVNS